MAQGDSDFSEFREGESAYSSGASRDDNPYPWTNSQSWRNELWQKGYEDAERRWRESGDDE